MRYTKNWSERRGFRVFIADDGQFEPLVQRATVVSECLEADDGGGGARPAMVCGGWYNQKQRDANGAPVLARDRRGEPLLYCWNGPVQIRYVHSAPGDVA